jgi:microcystin-dependent protein
LPDLRGRIPIHAGHGPGLSERRLGAKAGSEKVTLTVNQLPSHGHSMHVSTAFANAPEPEGRFVARSTTIDGFREASPNGTFSSDGISHIGGSRSHTNLMPFLCIHFIIALVGIYPSRH